jgi:hypothetical protein
MTQAILATFLTLIVVELGGIWIELAGILSEQVNYKFYTCRLPIRSTCGVIHLPSKRREYR